MRIAFDERGDGLWLRAGYGAESVYVCDLSGKPPTKRWIVSYKSVHPERKGQDGTVFPESIYDQDFNAYNQEYLTQFLNRDDWDEAGAGTHPDGQANPYKTFVTGFAVSNRRNRSPRR